MIGPSSATEGSRQERTSGVEQAVEIVALVELRDPWSNVVVIGVVGAVHLRLGDRVTPGGRLDGQLVTGVEPELLRCLPTLDAPAHRRRYGRAWRADRRHIATEQTRHGLTPVVEGPSARHTHGIGMSSAQSARAGVLLGCQRIEPDRAAGRVEAVGNLRPIRAARAFTQPRHGPEP